MITIQKINTLESGDTGLGKYQISEAGAALAHIPEFKAFYDADVYADGARRIMNRATGQYSEMSGNFNLVETPLRQLQKTIVSGNTVTHVGDYGINTDEWTFFFVAKPNFNSNTVQAFRFVRTISSSNTESIYLEVSASTKTLSIHKAHASSLRTSAVLEQALSDLSHPSLVIFSFSTERGATIRVNGVQVAVSTTEAGKVPMTQGMKAGEWDWFRNANGSFYAWGGFNIDLIRAVNADHLSALERYFMNKYQIPVLA